MLLLLLLGVATFAMQNSAMVVIQLAFWRFETSLVIVILGSAAAGALAVGVIGLVRQISSGLKVRDYQAKIRRLEAEGKANLERARKLEEELAYLKERQRGPNGQAPEV
ncbi:MAG: lipopolysaccharide assembly protein LapA domain-containing protein [Firmicutes bacterium]|nr:lipopolysaccharide assembly protein LapA domain-containing protein [Bacillota bacterium]MCL5040301.1 lipopolysaccharide assembly protein LapA domain-containing protein [Bacillota bacterium]